MHELSIAQNILDIVDESVKTSGFVKSIKLRIGMLANVVPDSLEFCFTAITKGTQLERTKLKIETINIVVHCSHCGSDSIIENVLFRCDCCGSTDVEIISGGELEIVEIEINDELQEPA